LKIGDGVKNYTSPYRNVFYNTRSPNTPWYAEKRITVDHKRVYILDKHFKTKEEAAAAVHKCNKDNGFPQDPVYVAYVAEQGKKIFE
jgi:hypothetical protein